MKIYAKQLDPECFDYRVYEDYVREDIIVEENRDYPGMHDEDLKSIKEFIDNYNCYDYNFYYEGKIKDYIYDYLPKKENGKKFSPIELHQLKQSLDDNDDEATILLCLSIIKGKEYEIGDIRGYCQGDWCRIYYPKDASQDEIDFLEAVYFGTGTEYEVHDEDTEVHNEDDISGFSILTAKWKTEDIKEEIASYVGGNPEDVVLYNIERSYTVKHNIYKVE